MSSNVYFVPVTPEPNAAVVQQGTRRLLQALIEKEGVTLGQRVPLKVHFGEKGNQTFIRSENFEGIIEHLKTHGIESCFMETSVLYAGQRYTKDLHEQLAREHGFTQLPLLFADGDSGESFANVPIDGKHFKTFQIGRAFLDYDQMIVISHFKGHILAGFGGAIKQLSMGCAAKGGKLAMHMGEKPRIKNGKCKRCDLCKPRCKENALVIAEKRSFIDHDKCVGCGACLAACPHKAITIVSFKSVLKAIGIGNPFIEKVVEGAYAAQKGKRNLYFNFAMNITRGCDCETRKMKPLMEDIGIFASTDPVAIDKACYDAVAAKGKKFRGRKAFAHAESLGMGSASYTLHTLA
jgi:uncharacterized Fe-S center protein